MSYYEMHKEEVSQKAHLRYIKNKEAYKARAWRNHLLRDYGISENEYEVLWTAQNGLCPICSAPLDEWKRKPHLDHDHRTGDIRGILCPNCNRGLGAFKDNIAYLYGAINYLEGKVQDE